MKKKVLKALLFLLKMFIVIIAFLFFADAFFVTWDLINLPAVIYQVLIVGVGILLMLWLFIKFNLILYMLLILFLLLYIGMRNFNSEIKEHHNWADCASSGNVWDKNQKRCRTDCSAWDEDNGCVPL